MWEVQGCQGLWTSRVAETHPQLHPRQSTAASSATGFGHGRRPSTRRVQQQWVLLQEAVTMMSSWRAHDHMHGRERLWRPWRLACPCERHRTAWPCGGNPRTRRCYRRAQHLHVLHSGVTGHLQALSLPCAASRQGHPIMHVMHFRAMAPWRRHRRFTLHRRIATTRRSVPRHHHVLQAFRTCALDSASCEQTCRHRARHTCMLIRSRGVGSAWCALTSKLHMFKCMVWEGWERAGTRWDGRQRAGPPKRRMHLGHKQRRVHG